mmetsp:Transcript_11363/g.33460  ORF Transcript_11363/g.33460 Transcript_11363/m.33460 type:complete len:510 (-) Transcript_11363:40-1569(-)
MAGYDTDDASISSAGSYSSASSFLSWSSSHLGDDSSSSSSASSSPSSSAKCRLERKFRRLLHARRPRRSSAARAKKELRPLCWSGVPDRYRAESWRVLLNYVPADPARRAASLRRKRAEYNRAAERCYGSPIGAAYSHSRPIEEDEGASSLTAEVDAEVLRQVRKDVPRTVPDLALFREPRMQSRLERALYVWSHRNPAAGYVQGMNDLAVPFFIAFLKGYHHQRQSEDDADGKDSEEEECLDEDGAAGALDSRAPRRALEDVPDAVLDDVEADVYWCLSRLLSGMQDHYTHAQPGIIRMIRHLEDVLTAIDPDLSDHFQRTGVEVLHFAFRWMNCLLVRELPLNCVLRLFDSYLSEEDAAGRDELHVYVCAAMLVRYSSRLRSMEHDDLLEGLTQPSTSGEDEGSGLPLGEITCSDVEVMLGQAHVWRTTFGGSRARIECARLEQKRGGRVRARAQEKENKPNAPSCSLDQAAEESHATEGGDGIVDRALSALNGVGVGMGDADFLYY